MSDSCRRVNVGVWHVKHPLQIKPDFAKGHSKGNSPDQISVYKISIQKALRRFLFSLIYNTTRFVDIVIKPRDLR